MAYGTVKVDNITFDNNGSDQNVTVSGLYTSLTSGITVTGTISGAVVIGSTSVSGTTVIASTGTFTSLTGTTIQGTTATYTTGSFTSLTGTTTTGTTANFASGVFTTSVSGTTVIASTGTFTSLTGTTIQGTTATYTTGSFTSLTGTTTTGTTSSFTSGVFTTLSGATATFTSGIIASGTNAAPSLAILGDADTGLFSPGANQLAISTNGTGRLFIGSTGNIGLSEASPTALLHLSGTLTAGGIKIVDSSVANAAPGIEIIGKRSDSNSSSSFAGKLLLSKNRTDAAINSTNVLGSVAFGGNHTNNTEANILYSASIVGEADGAFNSATDMPTALVFNTGSTGRAPDTANVTTGTERLRITSTGLVGIGTSSPSSLLHLGVATAASDGTKGVRISNPAGTVAMFECGSSNDSYIGTTSDSHFSIRTSNTPKITVLTGGNVGIGTSSPSGRLDVETASDTYINFSTSNNGSAAGICLLGNNNNEFFGYANNLRFATVTGKNAAGFNERMRMDSSGRLLVGTSTSALERLVIKADGGGIQINRNETGSPTSGQALGSIGFKGIVSANSNAAAEVLIQAAADENHSGATAGSRLEFHTKPSGTGPGSTPTERARITSAGALLVGQITSSANDPGVILSLSGSFFTRDSGTPAFVNRLTDNGVLISLRQNSTEEGTISVSGTTVSYNGAHLSRWSQLTSGAERIEILRGSVLSNLDEMCEWGEEENEQLNRMKVSTVEGDKNVSGVFQAWDDDDDTYTNDFYCAMTGDFIVRIAEGVTVERGDLLMSAGDGTAKPQDDDIIRSKTVAKVTSTNVSCTYDDGSYCVPCVLMAC